MSVQALRRAVGVLARACCTSPSTAANALLSAGIGGNQAYLPASVRHLRIASYCFSLDSVIASEIEYAKVEAEKVPNNALKTVPDGWSLEAKPSVTLMKLSKKVGIEDIVVSVGILDQEDGFEEAADGTEPSYPINFTVDVMKGDQVLRFGCLYMENDDAPPSVQDISLFKKSDEDSSTALYDGPQYDELEEKLQKELQQYILDRGITSEFGQYLCTLAYDKEQEEYLSWMHKLQQFVQ